MTAGGYCKYKACLKKENAEHLLILLLHARVRVQAVVPSPIRKGLGRDDIEYILVVTMATERAPTVAKTTTV
jgi:hypothetical protein